MNSRINDSYFLIRNLIVILLLVWVSAYSETMENDPQYRSYSFKVQLLVKDHNENNIDGEYMMLYSYALPKDRHSYFKKLGYVPFEKFVEKVDYSLLKDGKCSFVCDDINNAFVRMVLKEDLEKHKEYNKSRKEDFLLGIHKNGYDVRVLQDFISLDLDDYDLKSGKKYLGGKYELRVPYLEKAQKKRFVLNYQTLKINQTNSFRLPLDIYSFDRVKPIIQTTLNKDTLLSSDLLIRSVNNNIELLSLNGLLKFAQTEQNWVFTGYAPRKGSKQWRDNVKLLLSPQDSTYQTTIIYSEKLDLYGKIAIKHVGDHIESYVTFSTEKSNRYLSQLGISFGPKWLTKPLDDLKDKKSGKYGLIKFTPIPEWNYPVK